MIKEVKELAQVCSRRITIKLSPTDVDKFVREIQENATNVELVSGPEEQLIHVDIEGHHTTMTYTFKREK